MANWFGEYHQYKDHFDAYLFYVTSTWKGTKQMNATEISEISTTNISLHSNWFI